MEQTRAINGSFDLTAVMFTIINRYMIFFKIALLSQYLLIVWLGLTKKNEYETRSIFRSRCSQIYKLSNKLKVLVVPVHT